MTEIDLQKIARLARLQLSAEEEALFGPQLQKVLDAMSDLTNMPSSSSPNPMLNLDPNTWREDSIEESDNALEGHVKIPPIFDR